MTGNILSTRARDYRTYAQTSTAPPPPIQPPPLQLHTHTNTHTHPHPHPPPHPPTPANIVQQLLVRQVAQSSKSVHRY